MNHSDNSMEFPERTAISFSVSGILHLSFAMFINISHFNFANKLMCGSKGLTIDIHALLSNKMFDEV